jgi:cysteinyl-tRNA synthetase
MLQIYNTLTRKVEPFKPADPVCVKMFTCGPSIYQRAHIGNYRTFLYEDVLQRYLEYLGYKVTRAMALTDVEDKAIIQAKKEGLAVEALVQKNQAAFFKDFKLLHIKKPDYPVQASQAVDQAATLIIELVRSGFAYWATYRGTRNVYFRSLKFKGFGELSRLDMSKWPKKPRRFHKDTYPGTPWNMGDFILWHGCALEDTCFETAIGKGRPAWNIQDASIIAKTLGFQIDIACGGIDNLVRHHDYNKAIIEAASGKQFARYWLHGGHLFVNSEKMSKSIGNVVYPRDVTRQGFSGEDLRFYLIYGAYRLERDFTFELLSAVKKQLDVVRGMIADLAKHNPLGKGISYNGEFATVFEEHMNNDLDVKGAFDALTQKIAELHKKRDKLNEKEVKNALGDLQRINSVFNCLF